MSDTPKLEESADGGLRLTDCYPLVWTRSKPSASGYYWYRDHVQSRSRIYDVAVGARFGFAQKHNGEALDLESFAGWWAGPIPKPAPPTFTQND